MLEAAEAMNLRGVGLYVDPDNPAKQTYVEFGFSDIDAAPWPDPENVGKRYWRMVRKTGLSLPK